MKSGDPTGAQNQVINPKVDVAVLGCDYDEFKPWTYRGVYIQYERDIEGGASQRRDIWYTNDPIRDKNYAMDKAKEVAKRVTVLSSWDNFVKYDLGGRSTSGEENDQLSEFIEMEA